MKNNKEQRQEPCVRLVETDENGVVTEKVLKRFCIVYEDGDEGMHLERKIGKCTNSDVLLMYHSLKEAIKLFEEEIPELEEMEKFFKKINYLRSESASTNKGSEGSSKDSGGSIFEE